jgi:23S rRNA (cytidine1920-2'-O)/16S rRNA (cytidine1409-2'-O)-methyltransferase
MPKMRVDVLLVERGLAESRSQAQRLVMAGQVRSFGQIVLKPSATMAPDADLEIEQAARYVSRGGEKLAAALAAFPVVVQAKICADIGASTGGFTDCLLQSGAQRVYAIDVGRGILHWKLRQDVRVIVMEETNARFIDKLPEPVELATIDASFISVKILLPVVKRWLVQSGEVIALIKPQFEAGRREVAKGDGVIRDSHIHQRILVDILECAQAGGYSVNGLLRSPLLGPKGNVEFLTWLSVGEDNADLKAMVGQVLGSIE